MLRKWIGGDSRATLFSVGISAASLLLSLLGIPEGRTLDPAWIAVVLCGVPIVAGAAAALVRERDITADLLVSLAILASLGIGSYFAAGEVAWIMQLGSLLEDFTARKAGEGIRQLIAMTPQTAHVLRDGKLVDILAEKVMAGETLRVLPGETIPVDGTILEGDTTIDQSIMTGESIPVERKAGDPVLSGTVNQYGSFSMCAAKTCHDSSLQRMIRLAEKAQSEKAPIVHLADRWAAWLVLIALGCALITWIITGTFLRAVTVLVVFCPCAFVLATPTAMMAGIGNAAKHGVLVRSGDALERLSKVQTIAFDKTGTLTHGKPHVVRIFAAEGHSEEEILRYAALAEQDSEHPLGKAIREAWKTHGGKEESVCDFQMQAGAGVEATVDAVRVRISRCQMEDLSPSLYAAAKTMMAEGATIACVFLNQVSSGLIALSDCIREEAPAVIQTLHRDGLSCVLLTGDNYAAAKEITKEAGIDTYQAGLMPEDKYEWIKSQEKRGIHTAMVGDGVNDALSLRSAYAGIAMGGIGSDIAVESADAVLVHDELRLLPSLISLSHRVMGKIRQNILCSLVINLAAVLLSAMGVLNPITGALWHNIGSVFVVVNAALLLCAQNFD
ncbi:MAG: heavy metal translocating P-type ATPase [Lachnospiraceae bacterium]